MIKKSVLNFITSLIALSPIGLTLPSFAVNLSFTSTTLNLFNFSQLPQDIGVVADVDSYLIVEEGQAWLELTGDSFFVSDLTNSQAYAYSQWQTSLSGLGSDYVGKTNIFSQQYGRFNIPANTTFSFDLQVNALLVNQTDNYLPSALSSLTELSLTLQDEAQQKDWNIFNFEAMLNTQLMDSPVPLTGDSFWFKTSPELNIYDQEITFLSGEDDGFLLSFNGSWEMFFEQDTQLSLISTNRNCNYISNVEGVCDRVKQVPEPANILLNVLLCSLFFGYRFWKTKTIK